VNLITSLRDMFDSYEQNFMEKTDVDYECSYKRFRKRNIQADEVRF